MEHESAKEVNPAEEILTVDKLHQRLGHVSSKSAQKLVNGGFVTGSKLEPLLILYFFLTLLHHHY